MTGTGVARVLVDGCNVTVHFVDGTQCRETVESPEFALNYADFVRKLSAQFHGTPGPLLAYRTPRPRAWGQPIRCIACGHEYICDSTIDHGLD